MVAGNIDFFVPECSFTCNMCAITFHLHVTIFQDFWKNSTTVVTFDVPGNFPEICEDLWPLLFRNIFTLLSSLVSDLTLVEAMMTFAIEVTQ